MVKVGIEPRSAALEVDVLTTGPTRWSIEAVKKFEAGLIFFFFLCWFFVVVCLGFFVCVCVIPILTACLFVSSFSGIAVVPCKGSVNPC